MPEPWFAFVLAVLATHRVTHLLVREDGPANAVVRLRTWVGNGFLGQVMDCFYCLSVWVAGIAALVVTRNLFEWLLVTLAISGAACLLERFAQRQEPVMIQPLQEGAMEDAMLRSEPSQPEPDLEPGRV